MGFIEVGPNGELVLPREVRDQLGLKPGDRVRIDVDASRHTAVLRPDEVEGGTAAALKPYGLDDLIGIGGTFPRPVTREEFDRAIRERAATRHRLP